MAMSESESVNIGHSLRRRRQELNLSVEEVAHKTKIRKTYILAIEEERFEELPGKVYIVGFLQNYARFLGISAQPLVQDFHAISESTPERTSSRPELRAATLRSRRRGPFGRILLGLFFIVAVGTAVFYSAEILEIVKPSARQQTTDRPSEKTQAGPERGSGASLQPSDIADSRPSATTAAEQASSSRESEVLPAGDTNLPSIPEGGGTLKIISQGQGGFQIAIDGDGFREYLAQPGVTLSWQVQERADLKLDVEGTVRLVIDGQDYVAPGRGELLLRTPAGQEE